MPLHSTLFCPPKLHLDGIIKQSHEKKWAVLKQIIFIHLLWPSCPRLRCGKQSRDDVLTSWTDSEFGSKNPVVSAEPLQLLVIFRKGYGKGYHLALSQHMELKYGAGRTSRTWLWLKIQGGKWHPAKLRKQIGPSHCHKSLQRLLLSEAWRAGSGVGRCEKNGLCNRIMKEWHICLLSINMNSYGDLVLWCC